MPRYRIMMKSFLFEEQFRRDMADLSSGVRLHPNRNRLELMPIGGPTVVNGAFPTTANLHARTRLTTPTACRKWRGFFAILKNAKDPSGALLTDVRFRLNDGAIDRYWNGGANAWVPSAPNNWNTEQEVADNIDRWPSQSLQVVINLSTTRADVTPYVDEVRLAYETDLVFLEDYVVRSFMADLRENIRARSTLQVNSTGQTTINLNTLQAPYDVVGVDAVFNDTSDPTHFNPIAATFDVNTKLLSIPAQPSGDRITVNFLWRPDVALRKSQDFTEIAKIPVIVVDGTDLTNEREVRPRPYVINKATGAGWAFEEGYQADIRLPLLYMTGSARDLHALSEELGRYFANTNLLLARGQDEGYPYRVGPVFSDASVPTQKEVHSARLMVHVMNAVFYPEDAKPITGVLRFSVTGGNTTFEVTT